MAMMAAAGLCALGCMGAVEIRPGAVDVVLEKKYKERWWNPEDPAYSKYPKEMIERHNDEVKGILEDRLWGSDLDEFTEV